MHMYNQFKTWSYHSSRLTSNQQPRKQMQEDEQGRDQMASPCSLLVERRTRGSVGPERRRRLWREPMKCLEDGLGVVAQQRRRRVLHSRPIHLGGSITPPDHRSDTSQRGGAGSASASGGDCKKEGRASERGKPREGEREKGREDTGFEAHGARQCHHRGRAGLGPVASGGEGIRGRPCRR